jgi:hypothetical protein
MMNRKLSYVKRGMLFLSGAVALDFVLFLDHIPQPRRDAVPDGARLLHRTFPGGEPIRFQADATPFMFPKANDALGTDGKMDAGFGEYRHHDFRHLRPSFGGRKDKASSRYESRTHLPC